MIAIGLLLKSCSPRAIEARAAPPALPCADCQASNRRNAAGSNAASVGIGAEHIVDADVERLVRELARTAGGVIVAEIAGVGVLPLRGRQAELEVDDLLQLRVARRRRPLRMTQRGVGRLALEACDRSAMSTPAPSAA